MFGDMSQTRKTEDTRPDWKTPPYYFHKSLRWNFEDHQ